MHTWQNVRRIPGIRLSWKCGCKSWGFMYCSYCLQLWTLLNRVRESWRGSWTTGEWEPHIIELLARETVSLRVCTAKLPFKSQMIVSISDLPISLNYYPMKWNGPTKRVQCACGWKLHALVPICWHFQFDKQLRLLDWVGDFFIRLAIANHADYHLCLPDARVGGQKYWEQSGDRIHFKWITQTISILQLLNFSVGYIYWAHRFHGVKFSPVDTIPVQYRCPIKKAHYVCNLGFCVCAASGSSNATASKAGAIGLAVVLGFVLLAAIVAFSILGYRKWKARQSSGTSFQGAPPGGAFWNSPNLIWKHSADTHALQLWCSHVGSSIRHWQITSDTNFNFDTGLIHILFGRRWPEVSCRDDCFNRRSYCTIANWRATQCSILVHEEREACFFGATRNTISNFAHDSI